MQRALVVLVGVVALTIAGCGGGTTTIIEKTVVPERSSEKTYLPASGIVAKYVEPREYSFYVDGAVVGTDLTWTNWGLSPATATGTVDIRDPEGNGAQDRLRFPGSIEASGREECRGVAYYTEVFAKLPPRAPYHPEGPMPLLTPCRDPKSLPSVPAPPEMKAPSGLRSDEVRFETPSGNIVCSLSREAVHCEIFRKSYTPPVPKPPSCHLDYGHRVSVDAYGPSQFDCYGDSMSGIADQTLGYGHEIRRGRIGCLSEESGLVCETSAGAGFVLSAQVAKLL
jgi:hypothetical protein